MQNLRVRLAVLVGVAWLATVVDAMAAHDPTALGFSTPVMLVVVTGLFTIGRGNGNGVTK